jgi:hypothetical protein
MPDENRIDDKLRESYPLPSAAATDRARAAVTALARPPSTRRRRFAVFALAVAAVGAGAAAAVLAVHGGTPKAHAGIPSFNVAATYSTTGQQPPGECPALYRSSPDSPSPFTPALSDSAASAGSTVTASAPLPVLDEAGDYVGPGNPDITAYLNLDFDHWESVLRSNGSPVASVAGTPVDDLGTQHVAGGCNFQMKLMIPSVPTGTYPLVFLYRYPDQNGGWSGDAIPVQFKVTAG